MRSEFDAKSLFAGIKPNTPGVKVSLEFELDEKTFVSLLLRYVKASLNERGKRVFDVVAAKNVRDGESPSDAVVDALVQACVCEALLSAASSKGEGQAGDPAA